MKNWYVVATIRYVAKDGDDEISDTETFEYIIQGCKRNAIKRAKTRVKEDVLIGDSYFKQVIISIDDCYETSDDARL